MSQPVQIIAMRSRRQRRRPVLPAIAAVAALAFCAWFVVDGLPGRAAANVIALFN